MISYVIPIVPIMRVTRGFDRQKVDSCSDLNMVSPPTPPLTESDAQRVSNTQIAHSSASTSLVDATATIYQDVFPTISSLAIQNCHLRTQNVCERKNPVRWM